MGLFVLALFCLLSLTCYGYSSNKHMICKDVGDVFADVTNSGPHSRRLIGPSGKKGSKGEMGFHGSDGQPGTVDYDKVQEIVRLKVEEENRLLRVKVEQMQTQLQNFTSQAKENRLLRTKVDKMEKEIQNLTSQTETQLLREKIDKMETKFRNLTSQISETRALRVTEPHTVPQTTTQPTTVVQCVGGVIHEGTCYWAEYHTSLDTNYAEAEKICSNKRARLADIYGKVHYDQMMNYLRGKLNGRYDIYVWTRMKKIYGNNIAQLSNGSPAPYTRQRSERTLWDDADGSRTHVYLRVVSSTNDSKQGMTAGAPTWNCNGALCQTE